MANSHQIFNLSLNYVSGCVQVAVVEVGAVGNRVTKKKNIKIASHTEQIFMYQSEHLQCKGEVLEFIL